MQQCPHCGQTHPLSARACPETGKALKGGDAAASRGGSPLLYAAIIFAIVAAAMYVLLRPKTDGEHASPAPVPTQAILSLPTSEMQPAPPAAPGGAQPRSTTAANPAEAPGTEQGAAPIKLGTNPEDAEEIVFVPAGPFLMGSDPSRDPYFWGAESPEHTVQVDAFWIYRTEVTQAMYSKCVAEHACGLPDRSNDPVGQQYGNPRFSDYPVVLVTWNDADAYCRWAGARLPSEAEWEKAARGTDGRLFPWGSDATADGRANYLSSSPSAVGSYSAGASPYGALDMAGNVLEWVNDYFQSAYYQVSPLDNPRGPASGTRRVIRGGAFNQEEVAGLRTVARASLKPGDTYTSVGFRCAMNVP